METLITDAAGIFLLMCIALIMVGSILAVIAGAGWILWSTMRKQSDEGGDPTPN